LQVINQNIFGGKKLIKKEVLIANRKIFIPKKVLFKAFRKLLPISSMFVFVLTVSYLNTQSYGLALYYEGKEIATVENEATVEKANRLIKEIEPPKEIGSKLTQIAPPKYKLKAVNQAVCKSASEVKNEIISQSEDGVEYAVGVYSDGKLVAVVHDGTEIRDLLDALLIDAKLGDDKAETRFLENIELISGLYPIEDIKNVEVLKDIILNGVHSQIEYEVIAGDTLESIAETFGTLPEKILELNSLENSEIKVGDKLLLDTVNFPVHIESQKLEEERMEIPYQIIREADANQYEGWENKTLAGKTGSKITISKVSYINGQEVTRVEVSSEIVSEPSDEHISYGTKKRPQSQKKSEKTKKTEKDDKKGNKLTWPVPHTHNITSKYGDVDGAFRAKPHSGIDISSSGIRGKNIVAAADGTVISSGTANGYGNLVTIAHSNGMTTAYAHCEHVFVKSGQKVSAGERIADVGKTGNCTGYHVHFEVRENGKTKNPLNYF
jgi:Membrane proteins related to metalloendopeptidases